MRLLKLVPDDTNIHFLKWRNIAMGISFLMIVASIALVAVRGLNLGVDFVGGQSVRVEFSGTMPKIDEIREKVDNIGLGEATIQQFGSDQAVAIRTALPEGDKAAVPAGGALAGMGQSPFVVLRVRKEAAQRVHAFAVGLEYLADEIAGKVHVVAARAEHRAQVARLDRGEEVEEGAALEEFGGEAGIGAEQQRGLAGDDAGIEMRHGHGRCAQRCLAVYLGVVLFRDVGVVADQPLTADGEAAVAFTFRDAGFL